ncbi:GH3 auxin-responsive promoter family protein [Streptomyces sp. NBC_00859]|uniref:GH3 family domain-containing protein n=1 Tax=Streptomyces sp. NBC_00859 TaxID=2903682 RepID=UPI00386DD52C|nr:GH3 auxin-responsive promoter family protein [Streptomyces sp. NBC_00859]
MTMSEAWARPTDATPDSEAAYRRRFIDTKQQLTATHLHAAACQRRILGELLADNADTAFGREHGFGSIRTIDDYRSAVPVRTQPDYASWLDRSAAGERRVLTPEEPRILCTTSGSTGDRKRIPVTETFLRRGYLPSLQAAMGVPALYHPEAFARGAASLNLHHDRLAYPASSPSGRPSLAPGQADLLGGFGVRLEEPGSRAPWAELPVPLADDAHLDQLYVRVRMAAEHDVRSVIGRNPTMLAMLPELLAQWWPALLRDIRDGTYLTRRGGIPNPARAAELERRVAALPHGRPTPAAIWPHMRLLYCWTGGAAALYLPRLTQAYGSNVAVLPAPTAASEGPVGVPFDAHPTAGPLAVSCALYEFVDADMDVAPDSPTLLYDELEAGHDYHVVLSHHGGLYRYALGDIVHVVDQVHDVPRVEYAGRDTLRDIAGERLRELHIVRALREATRSARVDIVNVTCRIEQRDSLQPHYTLAVATREPLPLTMLLRFQDLVDKELGRVSRTYRHARSMGALGPARVVVVSAATFTEHWHRRLASGMRPPEIKDQVFQHDDAAWARITS